MLTEEMSFILFQISGIYFLVIFVCLCSLKLIDTCISLRIRSHILEVFYKIFIKYTAVGNGLRTFICKCWQRETVALSEYALYNHQSIWQSICDETINSYSRLKQRKSIIWNSLVTACNNNWRIRLQTSLCAITSTFTWFLLVCRIHRWPLPIFCFL
jgi:hypothetical protein